MGSRRRFLQTVGLAAVTGTGGCLRVIERYPSTGLLLLNFDDEPREVTVRVQRRGGLLSENERIYQGTLRVPADDELERESVVDEGPIDVVSFVEGLSESKIDGYFDFSGCRAARVVISVEDGLVRRVGKQAEC